MDLSKKLLKGKKSITPILGSIASGKTSLCTYLAKLFADNGLKVGFTSTQRSTTELHYLVDHPEVRCFSIGADINQIRSHANEVNVLFMDSIEFDIVSLYFGNLHIFCTKPLPRGVPNDFWSVRPDVFASYFQYETQILLNGYSSKYPPHFFYKNKNGVEVLTYG